MTDHELLGLPADATRGEVRVRFMTLARIHHPDRGGRAEVFADLVAAYRRLVSRAPERRRCPACDGSGRVPVRSGFRQTTVRCVACRGTGTERGKDRA